MQIMNNNRLLFEVLVCGSLLTLVCGCADIPVLDVPVKPTALPANAKLPSHAVLVLGKDLAD